MFFDALQHGGPGAAAATQINAVAIRGADERGGGGHGGIDAEPGHVDLPRRELLG
jgi:hypothetical protein